MRVEVSAVTYGVRTRRILHGINLSLGPGVTCVLGPNGAGKTSLLRVLATTLSPSSGTVRMVSEGTAVPIRRSRLGYVPQDFSFYPQFTTRQLTEYVAGMKQIPQGAIPEEVDRALDVTNLKSVANQRLGTLSGGTLQRAAIAQAIVNAPELLVLDEPTAGLDPSQRRAFMRLVASIGSERVVILSTHLVEDVTTSATRVLVMNQGRIVYDGTPTSLAGQGDGEEPSTERLADGYERVLAGDSFAGA